MCQTRVSNQPFTHAKYLFASWIPAYDILHLLQGSQWDRNHQSSHQNRAQDLLKIEGTRIIIFGKNVPRKFSPWRCRLRLPKTIGKYSLNVMCCNKLSIENQRWQDGGKKMIKEISKRKTWIRAALMCRASWNRVSSPQWGFNLFRSLAIRLCCLIEFNDYPPISTVTIKLAWMITIETWSSWCGWDRERSVRSPLGPQSRNRRRPGMSL